MQFTPKVKEILSWYEGENPGVKGNLARLLMHGRLAGSGKLVILPVDQGYEHGPARSFASNPPAYDPHYLYQLALDAGLSGYAAPLGLLEQGADTYAGQLPTILKMNSANSLAAGIPDQAVTASVKDALRLGCIGAGFTIYPGSDQCYAMMEELREIIREAKSCGLIAVVWSYPRGGKVSKDGETALDIVAYAAHMAALMGANVIKVKPPSDRIDLDAAKKVYETQDIDRSTLAARIRHVMQCCFAGKRLVVFSGGEATGTEGFLNEIRQIRDGGASGSIIGRNSFTPAQGRGARPARRGDQDLPERGVSRPDETIDAGRGRLSAPADRPGKLRSRAARRAAGRRARDRRHRRIRAPPRRDRAWAGRCSRERRTPARDLREPRRRLLAAGPCRVRP